VVIFVPEIVFNRLAEECDLGYLDRDIGSTRFDFTIIFCCSSSFFLLWPKFCFLLYFVWLFFVVEIVFSRFSGECVEGYLDRDIGSTRFDFRGMCVLKN